MGLFGATATCLFYLTASLALLGNLLLIYLIKFKSPEQIAHLKWILLNSALVCSLLSIYWLISKHQFVSGAGPGISVIAICGILQKADIRIVNVIVSLYFALLYYQTFSQCAIFVLHYIQICAHPSSTIRFHYKKLAICVVFILIILFCTNFLVAYLTTFDGKRLEALTENLTSRELLPRNLSYELYIHNWNLNPIYRMNIMTSILETFGTRPIILWCAFKVRKKLKNSRSLSPVTAKMKSEMYKALALQALFPVIVTPISLLIFAIDRFLTPLPTASSYLMVFSYSLLNLSQAIFGIWFVRPYRFALFACLGRKKCCPDGDHWQKTRLDSAGLNEFEFYIWTQLGRY